jgi:uncharacterized membrane protein HdeD (DUF308 family)
MHGGFEMKKLLFALMILVMTLGVSGCVAGPNELVDSPDEDGEVAGFWQGAWQGFISPFTFIISLFSDTVHVYEVHNNGNWYNFGFLFGASIFFGGSGGGAAARRRRRR